MWPLVLLLGDGENSEEDGAAAWSSWGGDRSDMFILDLHIESGGS